MASRGWEGITQTDISRRQAAAAPRSTPARGHKFNANPCIVAADGTLFTAADIQTAELASTNPLIGTGTLLQRGERVGIVGTWFASMKEGRRFITLRQLATAGAITELRLQVPFNLTVVSKIDQREIVIGNWVADFVYRRGGELVTEDTKGMKTPLYLRSKKHFQCQYGLPILET